MKVYVPIDNAQIEKFGEASLYSLIDKKIAEKTLYIVEGLPSIDSIFKYCLGDVVARTDNVLTVEACGDYSENRWAHLQNHFQVAASFQGIKDGEHLKKLSYVTIDFIGIR